MFFFLVGVFKRKGNKCVNPTTLGVICAADKARVINTATGGELKRALDPKSMPFSWVLTTLTEDCAQKVTLFLNFSNLGSQKQYESEDNAEVKLSD